jgi:hypothetical protein
MTAVGRSVATRRRSGGPSGCRRPSSAMIGTRPSTGCSAARGRRDDAGGRTRAGHGVAARRPEDVVRSVLDTYASIGMRSS